MLEIIVHQALNLVFHKPVVTLLHDFAECFTLADVRAEFSPTAWTEHLYIADRVEERMDGTFWGPIQNDGLSLHGLNRIAT